MSGGTVRETLEEVAAHKGADGLRHEGGVYGSTEDCRCETGRLCPFLSCPQYDCKFVWRGNALTMEGH